MINEAHVEVSENSYKNLHRGHEDIKHEAHPRTEAQSIAIASTFTADQIQHPLECWLKMLDIPAVVRMAPYAQLIQLLLDRGSLLSKNQQGVNIILMRLEDLVRNRAEESIDENQRHIRRTVDEFSAAIELLRTRTSVPVIVFFGCCSSTISTELRRFLEGVRLDLCERLAVVRNVQCWSHPELLKLYPIAEYEDLIADRLGHIPYVQDYFIALATLLARRVATLVKPRQKVIAVDCDNTLWKGVCGEDGDDGIELTPEHLEFQKMLVRQHDSGMLLCLCSKNNASDVWAVFRSHPEMPLREEHLVCSRIDWQSKSANLESIAEELGLSLDSFIFIDDSEIECAEVKARFPSVLTLQMPTKCEEITHLMNHAWAFDRVYATEEAKQRTVQYRQNRARAMALTEVSSLEGFLASLELKIEISMMQLEELARVAELVQRTNQFNLTTIRRSSAEIESRWTSGDIQVAVVRVRDRFGDYGLVGAVFLTRQPPSLVVDTFVLSCRVLGRGVEQRVVGELGRIARSWNLTDVLLRYRPTPRNTPAWEFLQKSCGQFRSPSQEDGEYFAEVIFKVPVMDAERIGSESKMSTGDQVLSEAMAVADFPRATPINHQWHDLAYKFSHLADVVGEVKKSVRIEQHERGEFIAPRTPMEVALAKIWAEVLGLGTVSAQADFFEIGGDSLLAVQVIARIESTLGIAISIYQFFESPTIAAIAARLEVEDQSNVAVSGSIAHLRREIDHMSDDAVRMRIAELEKELSGIGLIGGAEHS